MELAYNGSGIVYFNNSSSTVEYYNTVGGSYAGLQPINEMGSSGSIQPNSMEAVRINIPWQKPTEGYLNLYSAQIVTDYKSHVGPRIYQGSSSNVIYPWK